MFQTDFPFTLPLGYVDESGNLHKQGVMRRATAADEAAPLSDARGRQNEAWLPILLLSRVVLRIGGVAPVSPEQISRLFSSDFLYLQDLYLHINASPGQQVEARCPRCDALIQLNLGGSS